MSGPVEGCVRHIDRIIIIGYFFCSGLHSHGFALSPELDASCILLAIVELASTKRSPQDMSEIAASVSSKSQVDGPSRTRSLLACCTCLGVCSGLEIGRILK